MSFSTPALIPRDTHVLWYHPTTHPPPPTISDTSATNANDHHRQQHLQRRPPGSSHGHHGGRSSSASQHSASSSYRSQLAQINHDENALNARKASIQRFGSTWLRPPGVRKTYAAMVEEAQERADAALAAERERRAEEERQAALSMEITAEMETQGGPVTEPDALIATDVAEMEEDGMGMGRDLDDDVPEGEGMDLDDDEDNDSDEDDHDTDSIDDDGTTEDAATGELDVQGAQVGSDFPERDLDDDVPEAGSYEHTDTEEEYKSDDSDEGDEEEDEPTRPNPFQLAEARRQARVRQQASLEGSSPPGQMLSYAQARRRADEQTLLRQRAEALLRSSGGAEGVPSFERRAQAVIDRPSSLVTPENHARPSQTAHDGQGRTTRSQSRRQQDPPSQRSSGQRTSPVQARGAGARANAGGAPQGLRTPARPLFVVHQGLPGVRPTWDSVAAGAMAGGLASSPGDLAGQGTPEIDPESSMVLNSSPIGARGAGAPGSGPGARRGPRRML